MDLFEIETYHELAPHDQQEWLLTNGLGGFAASTVIGMNTRRYHGLLCAATLPPVGRLMTVNRIAETIFLGDQSSPPHELAVNTFHGSLHPRGDQYLLRFELQDFARWQYQVEEATITKELQLCWVKNQVLVRYTVDNGSNPFRLELAPFFSLRDFHALRHADGSAFQLFPEAHRVTVKEGTNQAVVAADIGQFAPNPQWWYGHLYPVETERGQDDTEDLWTPGKFVLQGTGKKQITLCISIQPAGACDWEAELTRRRTTIAAQSVLPENPQRQPLSDNLRNLTRAANDFIVDRKNPNGSDGATVIAGYPWFADWGRDTMISLPGLMMLTGRFRQAREVLTLFSIYVSEGMIPNRFDDYTNEPCYNTVDASLWFIHAAFEYNRLAKDADAFEKILKPACRQIIDGYRAGTRFFIKMDPADGLISQGDSHTQLTWMDAKCDGIAFTPRQGKPVEINALWYHALVLMGETQLAAKVAASFVKAFWISPFRGLADVVDGDRRDQCIRPNQIFAASLPNSPLSRSQQSAVVEVVQRELLTPMGLRTLSKTDPGYKGRYTGPQAQRDAAYHNGTVWPWLIGAFLEAYLKVNDGSEAAIAQARLWLSPLIQHMGDQAAIGQISEIFEGDEPHRPVGCPAQAWSVAEVLRLAYMLKM